jgi:5'-nucleotidase
MRILVTNDDGLHAPGLTHLAAAAAAAGHEVTAVAPGSNYSGSGAAIGDLGGKSRIRCREMTLVGLEEVQSIELDGPPALCVVSTVLEAFGERPELVLSGINPGLNTGRSTLHSGTVGAALTAANLGIPAVAVSIAGHEPGVVNWDVAAEVAVSAGEWVHAQSGLVTLNLNLPDRSRADLSGIRMASLAPIGAVHAEVHHRDDEWLTLGFSDTTSELPGDSDSHLVNEGYLAVTAITGIRAATLDDPDGLLSWLDIPPRAAT